MSVVGPHCWIALLWNVPIGTQVRLPHITSNDSNRPIAACADNGGRRRR